MLAANYLGRIGAAAAPALPLVQLHLGDSPLVPLLMCASLCLSGAALAALLPETLDSPAYDTIAELNAAVLAMAKRRGSWTLTLPQVFSRPRQREGPGFDATVRSV